MAFLFVAFTLMMMRIYPCLSVFSTGTLPTSVEMVAIGYDNSTKNILIFGGRPSPFRRFWTFNINTHTFTDHGDRYLTNAQSTYGWSQHYTQIRSALWMIQWDDTGFVKADTETYEVTMLSIAFPTEVHDAGCLAGNEDYLFLVGGGWGSTGTATDTATKITQIYRMTDGQWIENVPSLNMTRKRLSCIVYGDKLFAIGGDFGNAYYLDTIETLDISNIDSISTKAWDINWADPLTSGRRGPRSVIYGTNIYVIGGKNNDGDWIAVINVIDALTGTVTVGDTLAVATLDAASIVVENTLYIFGGWNVNGRVGTYQYSELPALPAKNPSAAPILSSNEPTMDPSESPITLNPSSNPSESPIAITAIPSPNPSETPITVNPTSNPSESPMTKNPSPAPSESPITVNPTSNPSESPMTDNPSSAPSESPITVNSSSNPSESPITANPSPAPSESAADSITNATSVSISISLEPNLYNLSMEEVQSAVVDVLNTYNCTNTIIGNTADESITTEILRCDQETQQYLVAYYTSNLTADILNEIENKYRIVVNPKDIRIDVDVIRSLSDGQVVERTTITGDEEEDEEEKDAITSFLYNIPTKTMIIVIVCGAVAYFLSMVLLLVWCGCVSKRKKEMKQASENMEAVTINTAHTSGGGMTSHGQRNTGHIVSNVTRLPPPVPKSVKLAKNAALLPPPPPMPRNVVQDTKRNEGEVQKYDHREGEDDSSEEDDNDELYEKVDVTRNETQGATKTTGK